MHILVVDDEEHIRFILKYNLELDGHLVTLAHNGAEALELAKQPPDLVLLDVMMPVMDGLEACEALKKDPETSEIPVFMLTAKTQMGDIEEAFRLGANDYLTKPFDADRLAARIEDKFNKYQQSRAE
ncbi:MAG: response regulator [FCB group bacterium]|nr:response regulator [FCB group bacterium]